MKKFLALFLSVCFAAGVSVISACAPANTPELRDGATITLFSTNDMHGNVQNSSAAIGVAQAGAIKASTQDSLLIDAGDATQGASFASVTKGESVIYAMNAAGYDLMAAGNHEFDYGTDVLKHNAAIANFPVLAANVKKDGLPLLDSSCIIEKANYKIGFVGITTASTSTSTNPSLLAGVTFEDEISTAKAEIQSLKNDVDAIVLVCHMGDNANAVDCTSEKLIKSLAPDEWQSVAAVIDGHSHTVENKAVEGIPVVQTGLNCANLGKVTITFKDGVNGARFKASGDVLSYSEAMNCALTPAGESKAAECTGKIAELVSAQAAVLERQLCTLGAPLFGGYVCYDYVESRIVETAYGDFVTDAFKYYGDIFAQNFAQSAGLDLPVIAVENGGGIGQSLPLQDSNGTVVKYGDVLGAFNHGNLVEVLKISPAELFLALEKGLVATGQDENGQLVFDKPSGSFLQCAGFSYTYNPSAPAYDPAVEASGKVTEVKLADGTVLQRGDNERKLLLATNNYVSAWFAAECKVGELGGEDMIIEDYILLKSGENGGVLDYACDYGRILIANDTSPEKFSVAIAVKQNIGDVSGKSGEFHLSIDGGAFEAVEADGNGMIAVELTAGAHYLRLEEGAGNYVYVNSYSGTGITHTKSGYFHSCFLFELPPIA